ncbi:uncharacterized protein LOC144281241 [Canis aureus]
MWETFLELHGNTMQSQDVPGDGEMAAEISYPREEMPLVKAGSQQGFHETVAGAPASSGPSRSPQGIPHNPRFALPRSTGSRLWAADLTDWNTTRAGLALWLPVGSGPANRKWVWGERKGHRGVRSPALARAPAW